MIYGHIAEYYASEQRRRIFKGEERSVCRMRLTKFSEKFEMHGYTFLVRKKGSIWEVTESLTGFLASVDSNKAVGENERTGRKKKADAIKLAKKNIEEHYRSGQLESKVKRSLELFRTVKTCAKPMTTLQIKRIVK